MLGNHAVTTILFALATGYRDRALNVLAESDEIDEDARGMLWEAITQDEDASRAARRLGDALRCLGAERQVVNECYRTAFYTGDGWKRLSGNELYAFFVANRAGAPLDKWVHYFPIYDRYLMAFRRRPVRVLEIGVYRGGGLDMLERYLGPEAHIVGIDTDPVARDAAGDQHIVELGDQADSEFLQAVVDRHGPFDVVIDDGGHSMRQQTASIAALFPRLNDGGVYLVEDTHTSYWSEYADQGDGEMTFIDWCKTRIDDLHAYHFSSSALVPPWQTDVTAIHVYDSVVVFEKGRHEPPFSEVTGTKEFITQTRTLSAIQLELVATRDAAIARADELEVRASAAEARVRTDLAALGDEVRILRGELAEIRQKAARTSDDLARTVAELGEANAALYGSWGIIREMRQSASWKVTAPLRGAKRAIRRQ